MRLAYLAISTSCVAIMIIKKRAVAQQKIGSMLCLVMTLLVVIEGYYKITESIGC